MARAEAKCLDGSAITRSEEIWAENPAGAKEAAVISWSRRGA